MKLRFLTYHLTLLCTAWLLLSACHDDTAGPATPVVGPNTYVRMQVQVASGRKQRATAAEEGLPRENSMPRETVLCSAAYCGLAEQAAKRGPCQP